MHGTLVCFEQTNVPLKSALRMKIKPVFSRFLHTLDTVVDVKSQRYTMAPYDMVVLPRILVGEGCNVMLSVVK